MNSKIKLFLGEDWKKFFFQSDDGSFVRFPQTTVSDWDLFGALYSKACEKGYNPVLSEDLEGHAFNVPFVVTFLKSTDPLRYVSSRAASPVDALILSVLKVMIL